MDQIVINILFGVAMAAGGVIMTALGWFARTLWDRLRELENRVTTNEILVARDYVSSIELASVIIDMKAAMVTVVQPIQSNIEYIRQRVDGIPQRRQSDPAL